MRKIILALVLFQIFSPSLYAQEEVGRIEQGVLKIVVKIVTSSGSAGTGFLVSQETKIAEAANRKVFLITNKHMLGDWNPADGNILNYNDSIDVFFLQN